MGNVAGSGGYYIAMGAKKIFAEPGTITGSIGVVGGKLVTGGLYEKLGMNTEIISRGKNSGALVVHAALHARRAQGLDAICSRRPTTISSARPPRAARWTSTAGSTGPGPRLHRPAGEEARPDRRDRHLERRHGRGQEAGRPEARRGRRDRVLPQPKSFFEQLFGGDASVSTDFTAACRNSSTSIRQAATWRRLLGEKTLLWMPYRVQVR